MPRLSALTVQCPSHLDDDIANSVDRIGVSFDGDSSNCRPRAKPNSGNSRAIGAFWQHWRQGSSPFLPLSATFWHVFLSLSVAIEHRLTFLGSIAASLSYEKHACVESWSLFSRARHSTETPEGATR